MNTNPYQQYKPTGISSMSQIPPHWETRRLGQIGAFAKGSGGNKDDEAEHGLPCIRYGDIYTSYKYHARQTRSYITPDMAPHYARIEHGDALFAGSGETIEDIGKSVVNLMTQEAYCGGDVILFKLKVEIHPSYLGYVLDCPQVAYQKSCMGRGITIMHIYSSQLKYLTIPLPPIEEQAAIVRYLDHADELISRYISAKERLIALLEEQRQAIVHQILIRGFERDRCLKDSGIPWAGHIPDNWEVRRLRTVADISTGGKDTINAVAEGKYPFFVRSQTVERIDTWSFDGEAVLIAGDGVGVGKVFHYINGKFDYHQRVYKFSQFTDISGRLFYHYLKAMLPFVTSQGTAKSTVDSLRLPMLQNLPIVVPPPHAQQSLTRQLDRIDTEVNQATEIASGQINLIDEYRTRLIADVVTGQIDVRDAVVELPKA